MSTIIMHDNTMSSRQSISKQLRERRIEQGLSLSDVARRAGSSAATLSRYEHGWTRFETYTLRKLALALDCDLAIELRPKQRPKQESGSREDACRQLSRLFWDHPLTPDDLDTHPTWVVERVLEYGDLSDVHMLRNTIGRETFLAATASAQRLSPRTRAFWSQVLEMEGIPCTKKYSRNTAWIS
jgi:transcriptional regulator with XRE-family HTH domain